MTKLSKKILLILFIGIAFLGFTSSVYAETDWITINNNEPIFDNVESFIPGDSVTSNFKIENTSSEKSYYNIEVTAKGDSNKLASVLELESGEASIDLSTLLKGGHIVLSEGGLESNSNKDFSLTMNFKEDAKNKYQNESINFSLLFTFLGKNGTEDEKESGGGATLPAGLTITYETEEYISPTSVIITWHTNYEATSRIIYGAENESHTFDLGDTDNSPSLYGYESTTKEDESKETFHKMELTDLEPNTTYHYRCVSRASPPTIGKSQKFTTQSLSSETEKEKGEEKEQQEIEEESQNQEEQEEGRKRENKESEIISEKTTTDNKNESEKDIIPKEEKQKEEKTKEESNFFLKDNLTAALSSFIDLSKGQLSKIFFVLFILLLIYTIYRFIKDNKERKRK